MRPNQQKIPDLFPFTTEYSSQPISSQCFHFLRYKIWPETGKLENCFSVLRCSTFINLFSSGDCGS